MYRLSAIVSLLLLLFVARTLVADPVSASITPEKARLTNGRIQVDVDLVSGTFGAVDLSDPSRGFRDAAFEVGEWNSKQDGLVRRATERAVHDALGTGRALTIECAGPGRPTILLDVTLYEGEHFITLGYGVENTTGDSLRIKEFRPVAIARAFPTAGRLRQARTLNGEGGGRPNSVEPGLARLSSNDVLATFRDGAKRRSVVLGGLTYHEWMKSAGVWPTAEAPSLNAQRRRDLGRRIAAAGGNLCAYLDCGPERSAGTTPGVQLRAVRGKPWDFASVFAAPCYSTVLFDDQQVEIEADGLDPTKQYVLGFSWWDYSNDGRVESVRLVSGPEYQAKTPLLQREQLPAYAMVREQLPVEKHFAVPPAHGKAGKMTIQFAFDEARKPGSNAVVSDVWLAEGPADLAARLSADEQSGVHPDTEKQLYLHAEAKDPVGRRVAPGERYLPDDRFYLDFSTDDPFKASEAYGRAIRRAHHAKPNPYIFPTVCSWYAGVICARGAQNHPENSRFALATTTGHVGEMDFIRTTGFLRYAPVAVRLVPDNYTRNNPQGWWDDRHWQEQGFYTPPYDTSEKWGQALQQRGGLAFTYVQSDRVSADFRAAHPDLLLSGHRTFDYTKPETRKYLQGVYAPMRGNVSGMMFDYCDEFWCFNLAGGGFADDQATAASVYRIMFRLAKQGLGPQSWIHERPIHNPGSDMAVGLIDSQRTSGDTVDISPALIAKSGLRWYKNRVLFAYDMDSKNLTSAWRRAAPAATDQDGRRMTLTMSYVTASRLLLANSFRDFSPEMLHDLSRVYPFHTEPKSARPVDAFVTPGPPRVYDFIVSPDWHQLTLLETGGTGETELTVPLAGQPADGALGLDPNAQYYLYDFWNDAPVGRLAGTDVLRQKLRPGEARMLSVHRVQPHPQFLSTNRHLMQGYVDLVGRPKWNAKTNTLSGVSKVVGGEPYEVILAPNGRQPLAATAPGAKTRIEPIPGPDGLLRLTIETPQNADVPWSIKFNN